MGSSSAPSPLPPPLPAALSGAAQPLLSQDHPQTTQAPLGPAVLEQREDLTANLSSVPCSTLRRKPLHQGGYRQELGQAPKRCLDGLHVLGLACTLLSPLSTAGTFPTASAPLSDLSVAFPSVRKEINLSQQGEGRGMGWPSHR